MQAQVGIAISIYDIDYLYECSVQQQVYDYCICLIIDWQEQFNTWVCCELCKTSMALSIAFCSVSVGRVFVELRGSVRALRVFARSMDNIFAVNLHMMRVVRNCDARMRKRTGYYPCNRGEVGIYRTPVVGGRLLLVVAYSTAQPGQQEKGNDIPPHSTTQLTSCVGGANRPAHNQQPFTH